MVAMSGSSATCFTSSGAAVSAGASPPLLGKRLRRERIDPGGGRRDGGRDLLRHVVGRNFDGLTPAGFAASSGLPGTLGGSAGGASTLGRAEVVAGSATCFGKLVRAAPPRHRSSAARCYQAPAA